jgi:hypothetical protein
MLIDGKRNFSGSATGGKGADWDCEQQLILSPELS